MAPSSSPSRLVGLDFWRGVCLIMIFVNHIPGNPLTFATLRVWGFADAAEIFVFIAGCSAMLAFDRYFRNGGFLCGVLRTGKRVWQLFCAHVLLVFAMAIVIASADRLTDSKTIMEQMNFSPFFVETEVAVLKLAGLHYMPNMTDILPIYIVFVTLFPLVWIVMERSSMAALGLSCAVWLWAQFKGHTLPNYPDGMTWFFNPLAWQFLFVCGVVTMRHRDRLEKLVRSRVAFGLALVILTFSAIAAAPWTQYPPFDNIRLIPASFLDVNNKANLSWIRLVNAFAIILVGVRLFCAMERHRDNPVFKAFRTVGRHSLPVYCCGVVLALAMHIALGIQNPDAPIIAIATLEGLVLLFLLALSLEKASRMLAMPSATTTHHAS